MKRLALRWLAGSLTLYAALICGCDREGPTSPDNSVIMPLKVGKMWIGRKTTYDESGDIIDSKLDTLKINDSIIVKGETWFIMNDVHRYINRSEGLFEFDDLTAKYPASAGDTFNIGPPELVMLGGKTDTLVIARKVFAVDEFVTVPAGNYRCYHYAPVILKPKGILFGLEEHGYYTPDVGPIRLDEYAGGVSEGYLAERWELVEVVL